MGLQLPKKINLLGAIGNAIGGAAKTVANTATLGVDNLTGNQAAANSARAALVNAAHQTAGNASVAGGQVVHDLSPSVALPAIGHSIVGMATGAAQFPVQLSENYNNYFANVGRHLAGAKNQTIQQNMGGDRILNKTLKFSQATGKNRQLVGDIAQLGLAAGSGGIDSLAEKGAAKVLTTAAPRVLKAVAPKIISGATQGAGFNAIGAEGNSESQGNVLKAARQGAIAGAALAGTPAAAKETARLVKENGPSAVASAAASSVSGLKPHQIVNENEANMLRDEQSRIMGEKTKSTNQDIANTRAIAKNIGLDISAGSPAERAGRIADYISQRTAHLKAQDAIAQGGYLNTGKGGDLPLPEQPVNNGFERPQAELQKAIEDAHNAGDTATEAQLAAQLPDQAMNPNATLSDARRAELMAKMHQAAPAAPAEPAPFSPEDIKNLQKMVDDGETSPENFNTQSKATDAQIQEDLGVKPPTKKEIARVKAQSGNQQFLRDAQENTDLNPVKVNIPEAAPGDYPQARINPQLASNPVQVAGQVAQETVAKLSPTDKANFFDYVEHPEDINKAEAPAKVQEAVNRFKTLTDTIHATSQSLGGNTNYLDKYALHNLDLSTPEAADKFAKYVNSQGGVVDPARFKGLNNQNRVFNDLREARAAGFKTTDAAPEAQIADYAQRSAHVLKNQATIKGAFEADLGDAPKTRSIDLKNGQTIPLSEKGFKEFKSLTDDADPGKALQLYRKVNRSAKANLLSLSLFHTNNINALQAFPTLVLRGHPVLATRGLAEGYGAIFSKDFSNNLKTQALKDGTIDGAARIGTPISFGSDFSAGGKLAPNALRGEKAIFERSLPAMHMRFVQAVLSDLDRRGVSLDSAEAKAYGNEINQIMGFVNKDVRNFDPRVQRGLGDLALAPQFTRTKWETLRDALSPSKKNVHANNLARQAVIGKALMEFGIAVGVGALLNQKSDNLKDLLIRTLVHPSIPTPLKDAKGNTIELGLPANYVSEAAGLGAELKRNGKGRLSVTARPDAVAGNLANYGRARLAVVPSNALKVATNTNYAGKPLYDPNAKGGKQAIQGATTVAQGLLPIGLQGALQTQVVKNKLPGSAQEILNANQPGTNSLEKSGLSAVGATARTDKTVGKGLQSTQYYNALDDAKAGLNRQEKDALDLYSGSKKNPVTGKYDVMPNVNDSRAKATALLQNPVVIDRIKGLNDKLSADGQKVDPLWQQSKENITKYLQYQAMLPGSADRAKWQQENPWYVGKDGDGLVKQRSDFFDSLPPTDPNKPQAPIEAPVQNQSVQNQFSEYGKLEGADAASYLQNHSELTDYMAKEATYTNQVRVAMGADALRGYPTPSKDVQAIIDTYNGLPKGNGKVSKTTGKATSPDRSAWIAAHPDAYAQMNDYFSKVTRYSLDKAAAQDQLISPGQDENAQPDQKYLKAVYSMGQYDVSRTPNASGGYDYSLSPGEVSAQKQAVYQAKSYGGGSSGGLSSYQKKTLRAMNKVGVKAPHARVSRGAKIKKGNTRGLKKVKLVRAPKSAL